jgi:hypothetical protein
VADPGDDSLRRHIHLNKEEPRRPVSIFSRTNAASGMMRFSGVSSVARDEHVAEVPEHAAQLQRPQQILCPVTGEARCPRKPHDCEKPVALDKEESRLPSPTCAQSRQAEARLPHLAICTYHNVVGRASLLRKPPSSGRFRAVEVPLASCRVGSPSPVSQHTHLRPFTQPGDSALLAPTDNH